MDLFLNQDSQFFFPWMQVIEILCLSLLCAFFSTFGPTTELTRKQISAIFRQAWTKIVHTDQISQLTEHSKTYFEQKN